MGAIQCHEGGRGFGAGSAQQAVGEKQREEGDGAQRDPNSEGVGMVLVDLSLKRVAKKTEETQRGAGTKPWAMDPDGGKREFTQAFPECA